MRIRATLFNNKHRYIKVTLTRAYTVPKGSGRRSRQLSRRLK
jgi:hypothetical protein